MCISVIIFRPCFLCLGAIVLTGAVFRKILNNDKYIVFRKGDRPMEIFSSLSPHISSSEADLVTLSFKDFVRKVFFYLTNRFLKVGSLQKRVVFAKYFKYFLIEKYRIDGRICLLFENWIIKCFHK